MSWSRIRRQARCAFGHAIWAGEWALFGRPPFVLCEAHARDKYGLEPPQTPGVPVPATEDVKQRQTGELE